MTAPMFDQWRARSPYYDERHEAVCDTVRAFVAREITPNVDAWETAGQLPRDLHKKAAAAGVLGLNYPEEFGGTGTAGGSADGPCTSGGGSTGCVGAATGAGAHTFCRAWSA